MRGHTHYLNATIAAAFTMLAYLIPRDINHRYGLYKDVRKFRILIYTVVSSILLLYFFLLKDCLHKKGQGRAIETTASISQVRQMNDYMLFYAISFRISINLSLMLHMRSRYLLLWTI